MTKYGAKRTEWNGRTFASKAEATWAMNYEAMQATGLIRDLEYQPAFDLTVNGVKVGRYVADFAYVDADSGERVVVDIKGVRTPVYKLKAKLVRALYGITIEEIAA